MEAFHWRYHPMAARLQEILQSGSLGALEHIDIDFSAPLAKPGDIRYRLDLAGGAMMDMGCYTISLLRLLCGGEPVVTSAKAKRSSRAVDRAMQSHLTLPDGGTARVRCSMFSSSLLALHATVRGGEGDVTGLQSLRPPVLQPHHHQGRFWSPGGAGHAQADLQFPARRLRRSGPRRHPGDHRSGLRHPQHGRHRRRLPGRRASECANRPYKLPTCPASAPPFLSSASSRHDAALEAAERLGYANAEIRIESIRSQAVRLRDAELETAADDAEFGMGVRVLHDGALGFAGSAFADPATGPSWCIRPSTPPACVRVPASSRVELAPEPSHGTIEWTSAYEVDPVDVSLEDKVALFASVEPPPPRRARCRPRHRVGACGHRGHALRRPGGHVATQRRVRLHPAVEVPLTAPRRRGFETMRTSPLRSVAAGSTSRATGGTSTASSPSCPSCWPRSWLRPRWSAGRYDLVIDPTNLWLTIHESIGHATELDRAMGYEAAYAGTSFATFDKLGILAYGSPIMHVTGDRTTAHGLATVGHRRRGGRGASRSTWSRDGIAGRLPARPRHRARKAASGAPTAAPSPTRRSMSRSSGWPTSRCSRPKTTDRPPRS